MARLSVFSGKDSPILISERVLDNCVIRGVVARRPCKLSLVRCSGARLGLIEWRHLFTCLPALEVWSFNEFSDGLSSAAFYLLMFNL